LFLGFAISEIEHQPAGNKAGRLFDCHCKQAPKETNKVKEGKKEEPVRIPRCKTKPQGRSGK
jgi:hypothetical protein